MDFRKILIFLAFMPIGLFSQPYYISPTGDDVTGDGSIGNPWFSIGRSYWTFLSPGDTVYCRGGIYDYVENQQIYVSGTQGNEIVFINYPGETPVFDYWTWDMSGLSPAPIRAGIYLCCDIGYLKFEGLHVRRLFKINTDNGRAQGWYLHAGVHHMTFTECKADSIAGRGFFMSDASDIFFYNCDAWWCADPQDEDPGNAGVGFGIYGTVTQSMEDSIILQGCRAWLCSDQGYAGGDGYYTIFDSCWAFVCDLEDEGYWFGGDQGFKPGYTYYDVDSISVLMKNCISVFNGSYGINENTDNPATNKLNMRVYNSFFYKNGLDGIYVTPYFNELDNIVRYVNNISFDNGRYDMWKRDSAIHYYNSWDEPYYAHSTVIPATLNSPATVNTADFLALPSNQDDCITVLAATRKLNGSLPDIGNYFKLVSGSDLRGIGTELGYGTDLGPFQYEAQSPAVPAVTLIALNSGGSRKVIINGNVIDDGGGTVSARGSTWDTSTDPDIGDDSFTQSGSGTGTFSVTVSALTPSTLYYFRTYATNEAGTAYSDNYTLTTADKSPANSGGKWIISGGKIVEY